MEFGKERFMNRLRTGRRRVEQIGGSLQENATGIARRLAKQTGSGLKHTGESLVAVERSMVRTARLHPVIVSLIGVSILGLIVASFLVGRQGPPEG